MNFHQKYLFTTWHVQYQQAVFSLNLDFNKFPPTDVQSLKLLSERSIAIDIATIDLTSSFCDEFTFVWLLLRTQLRAKNRTHQNNETICHRNKTALKFMLSSVLLPFKYEVETFKFAFASLSPSPPYSNVTRGERILCKFSIQFFNWYFYGKIK